MYNILHLKAPGDWINDPNGFIYYKGKYHLFYQYYPCSDQWGLMHWGHAVSEDLIKWHHLGIALFPTKPYDRNGCFSGSALCLPEGGMALFYTGVRYLEEDEDNINHYMPGLARQCQVMIESDDGFNFDNYSKKRVIIPAFTESSTGHPSEFRDPKVIKTGDKYFMVTGSTDEYEKGVLLVYKSSDAREWMLAYRLADNRLGKILECPDLFMVNDKWILVCSPMYIACGDVRPHQSIIQEVEFDADSGEVKLTSEQSFLDYGMDLYAPQSNIDENGLRTYFGWIRMPHAISGENNSASNGRSWNGMMSLPRVIEVVDSIIYTRVHPKVNAYFDGFEKERIFIKAMHGGKPKEISATKQVALSEDDKYGKCENTRITVSLDEGDIIDLNGFIIGLDNGCVYTDRTKVLDECTDQLVNRISITPYVGSSCELDIFMESNLAEVFINNGLYVITNFIEMN